MIWSRLADHGTMGRRARLDAVLVASVALLTAWTAFLIVVPTVSRHITSPALDLVLDTVAFVAVTSVAILGWVRYSEGRQSIWLFQAAAFLALAIADAMAVAVAIRGSQVPADSLGSLGQAQLFVWTIARILAATLLVVGGAMSLRGDRPRHPAVVLAAPPLVMLGVIAIVVASGALLPSVLAIVVSPVPLDLSVTPLGSVVLVSVSLLLLWAAALTRRLWIRDGFVGLAYVAIGLVFAAFGQFHEAVFPSVHPQEVASGDVLWLVFSVALIIGIEAEARDTLAALRRANESLERLRDAEVDRAALEERARLSRELHDGLAQDLWLAKLKAGRLAALPDLGPEATILSDELASAIDSGLADARQAVMALRLDVDGSDATLTELLRRYLDDFQDRFGLRVDVVFDDELPPLRPRVKAELLRIAQEALSNVRRHADATVIRVLVSQADGRLTLQVRDNGRGFEPATVAADGFGLAGMKERAAIIGGLLTVESRPADGTSIRVDVPLATGVRVPVAAS